MDSSIYFLNKFVEEKNLSDGAIINKKELEAYFIEKSNMAYPTVRNYLYVLRIFKILIENSKINFILDKKILDSKK